jgi:hypothetical protein
VKKLNDFLVPAIDSQAQLVLDFFREDIERAFARNGIPAKIMKEIK